MKFVGRMNSARNPQIDKKWLKSQKYTATVVCPPETRAVAWKKKKKERGKRERENANADPNTHLVTEHLLSFRLLATFLCENKIL